MKFIFGALVGMLMGALLLIGTVVGFVGGLVVGWQLFADDESAEPTTTEEVPVT